MEIKCMPVSDHGTNHMKEALEQAMSYRKLLDTHKNLFIVINVERGTSTSEERTIEFYVLQLCPMGSMFSGSMLRGVTIPLVWILTLWKALRGIHKARIQFSYQA